MMHGERSKSPERCILIQVTEETEEFRIRMRLEKREIDGVFTQDMEL